MPESGGEESGDDGHSNAGTSVAAGSDDESTGHALQAERLASNAKQDHEEVPLYVISPQSHPVSADDNFLFESFVFAVKGWQAFGRNKFSM